MPSTGIESFFWQIEQFFENIEPWILITAAVVLVLFFILLAIVVSILQVALSSIGRAGLVRGAWMVDEGAERLKLGELLKESLQYFWRIFGLYILLWLVSTMLVFVVIAIFLIITIFTLGIGLLCLIPMLIPLICIMVPVSWAVTALIEFIIVAIVGEDIGIMDGVKRAWGVARNNLGPAAVMTLILIIGGGIVHIVIAIPAIAIVIPLVLGGVGSAIFDSGTPIGIGVAIAVALLCLYLPVAILLGSVLQAYIISAWTLTFRRLTGRGVEALVPVEQVE